MTDTLIQGTVEKLIFGGNGLIRHEGFVIFVPGVIPGERIVAEITIRKKNYAFSRLVQVLQPSPLRIAPRCPHFGACGGCQLQHIDPRAHADIKQHWIEEAFAKFPLKQVRFHPAQEVFFWRRKITLHACQKAHHWTLGYFENDNTSLFPLKECPLFFTPEENYFIGELHNSLSSITLQDGASLDCELFRLPSRKIALRIETQHTIPNEQKTALLSLLRRITLLERFSLECASWRHEEGGFCKPLFFSAFNQSWRFSLQAFIQNHLSQSEQLWKDAVECVHTLGDKQVVFDLYAGIGVTATVLAQRGHDVTAVEVSQEAVSCGKSTNSTVHFIADTVERAVPKIRKKADCWVMNPPRTGLSKKMLELTKRKAPKHIVYVSCSPATLARDVGELLASGWHIVDMQGYDMFPQTTHLETIVTLSHD